MRKTVLSVSAFVLFSFVVLFPGKTAFADLEGVAKATDAGARLAVDWMENSMDIEVQNKKASDREKAYAWYFVEKMYDLGISRSKDEDIPAFLKMDAAALQEKYTNYKRIYKTLSKGYDTVNLVLEGKYDDAAIRGLYAVAEAVNHPIPKLACAAAAMAYESQKMVWDTKAALDIEAIYGKISNDGRLFKGKAVNSDEPPVIPETAEMADYFTQKYVFTDEATRALVKNYMVKVLKRSWPEQTWGNWISSWMAVGSGVDTREADDIAAAAAEYEHVRDGILELIKDVNKQAKAAWAAARLRQGQTEFGEYIKNVGAIDGDFQRVLAEFQSRKELEKQIPEWRKWLKESPAELVKAHDLLKDPRKLGSVRQLVSEWNSRMTRAYSGARVIGEEELAEALRVERLDWMAVERALEEQIDRARGKIISDPGVIYEEAPQIKDAEGVYKTHFEPLIAPFNKWDPSEDDVKSDLMYFLNQGKLWEARSEVLPKWDENSKALDEYYGDNFMSSGTRTSQVMLPVMEKKNRLLEDIDLRIEEIKRDMESVEKQKEGLSKRFYAALEEAGVPAILSMGFAYTPEQRAAHESITKAFDPQFKSLSDQLQKMTSDIGKKNEEKGFVNEAYKTAWEVKNALQSVDQVSMNVFRDKCLKVISEFEQLKMTREKQYQEWLGYLAEFESVFPMRIAAGKATEYSQGVDNIVDAVFQDIDEAIGKLKDSEYAANYPFTGSEEIYPLVWEIGSRAEAIRRGGLSRDTVYYIGNKIMNLRAQFVSWDIAAEKWKALPKPEAGEILEIKVLVGSDEADQITERSKWIEKAAFGVDEVKRKLEKAITEYEDLLDSDELGREKDADWLDEKARQIEWFLKEQDNNKVIRNIGESFKPRYVLAIEGSGYALTERPYRHYMSESELERLLQEVTDGWEKYSIMQFIRLSAPRVYENLKKLVSVPEGVDPAPEDNFLAPAEKGEIVIWASNVSKFEEAAASLKYDASDIEFMRSMNVFTETIPGAITSSGDASMPYDTDKSYGSNPAAFDHPLGKRYVGVLKELDKIFEKRKEHLKKSGTGGPGPGGPETPGPTGPHGPGGPKTPPGGPKTPDKPWGFDPPIGPPTERDMDFYQLYDARVNSISLRNASGEVVLTNSEVKQNRIELTARLSTVQRIEKILVSVDGGLSWNEVTVDTNIRYDFTPIPNKVYRPVVRIKTIDITESEIKFFPNIEGIVYKDIDYDALVIDTIKRIAEAYEGKNVGLFSDYVSRDFFGNRTYLVEGIRFDFDMFNDIRLVIFVNRIEQRNGLFAVDTKWNKTQVPRSTGAQQRTSGNTTFVFVMEEGRMKIQNLRGNLIYATLSPEIAESSGLSQAVVEEIREANNTRTPVQPGAGETEESGGVSLTVPVQNASLTSAPPVFGPNVACFDFATGSVIMGSGNGDLDFTNGNMFAMNGGAQIQQSASSFNAATEAPAGGYGLNAVLAVGNVYVFVTRGGLYGKLEILTIVNNFPIDDTVTFKYAVQPDGSRNISTQ